jgi:preprotein translocase subunit SecG
VFELVSPLSLIIFFNSFVLIGLILNQNESNKDAMNTQSSTGSRNPLENFTWVCLFIQLCIFFIKIKINES